MSRGRTYKSARTALTDYNGPDHCLRDDHRAGRQAAK